MKHLVDGVPPRSIRLAAEIVSADLVKDHAAGGWLYRALGQIYKKSNDRLMYFFPNSGKKTIKDRVPRAAVKIKNGHPHGGSVREVLGFVAEAQELQSGVQYQGFISKTEEQIADKISDRSITENSMELIPLQTIPKSVDIETVPEISRPFATLDSEGQAILLGVKAYFWDAIGLVAGSSQDINAIIEPPTMIPLQSFPLGSGNWDGPTEAARLKAWGRESFVKLSTAHLVQLCSPDGEMRFFGQIASPDEEGRMVINLGAIPRALEEVKEALGDSEMGEKARKSTLAAAYTQASLYFSRQASSLTLSIGSGTHEPGTADGEQEATESIAPATAKSVPEPATAASSQTAAGPAESPSTVGSAKAAAIAAEVTHIERQVRLTGLQRRYREVAHEPAGTGRRPTEGGGPGAR